MNIIAKQIRSSNMILAFADNSLVLPEPSLVFSAYHGDASKGSMFSDNTATGTRIFEFPTQGIMWIFEPSRIRLEDKKSRTPDVSKLGHEMARVVQILYPKAAPTARGVNYDIIYRMDSVIPTGLIMANFLKPEAIEEVKDFGWQYTLAKEKGKKTETYFFKAASPIEWAIHANFHQNEPGLPKGEVMQKEFETSYVSADRSLNHMNF
jgi:hypothetical protein